MSELEELRAYKAAMEARIETIKEATRQQSAEESQHLNPFASGYANGLRAAVAILKDEPVRFRADPPQWTDPDYVRFPTRHGGMRHK